MAKKHTIAITLFPRSIYAKRGQNNAYVEV